MKGTFPHLFPLLLLLEQNFCPKKYFIQPASLVVHNNTISSNFFHSGETLETSGCCQQMLIDQLSRNKYWQGTGESLENPYQSSAREDLFQGWGPS